MGRSTKVLSSADLQASFERAVGRIVPRILTQVNRDWSSPSVGSFDRNWWHYKIRDFSSIILQQGAYALAEASKLKQFEQNRENLQVLACEGARFWNERACRRGAFEEYYPWEQGYPPLAFSSLATGKLLRDGVVPSGVVEKGARVAIVQLANRFEEKAGNQQVAGLAALAVFRNEFGGLVSDPEFNELAVRALALQHEEGWYVEYDGPDLGYLAVTIDCLWDLHDTTRDERFLESARRALRFIAGITAVRGRSAGMLNARNTDYIVPYGIVRFALEDSEEGELARGLAVTLYESLDDPGHFLAAIDDRYLSHYVGHSFIRALGLLESGAETACSTGALLDLVPGEPSHLPGCGYVVCGSDKGLEFLGALKKGGVFSLGSGERTASDFGWLVEEGDTLSFNHWWSPDWQIEIRGEEVEVSGNLYSHKSASSSPFKHFVLRVLSFTLGSRIIGLLKSKLIFKDGRGSIHLRRVIRIGDEAVEVEDTFSGLRTGTEPQRAGRASKRHVSSADSFHAEDLDLCRGVLREEERIRDGGGLTIQTRYAPAPRD